MKHVLFVHGMNGDETSWVDFDERFTNSGRIAKKLTLPGHNSNIPLVEIPAQIAKNGARHDPGVTMQDYVDHVVSHIPTGKQAVLVGHSMGGAVISQVALQHPDKVEKLVFVGAMIPNTGDSIQDIEAQIKDSPDFNPVVATADITLHVFQGMKFVYQPSRPLAEKLGNNDQTKSIPKVAIITGKDPVIPPKIQREAAQVLIDSGHDLTFDQLETGHFPMFDKPNTLQTRIETHL